MKAVQHFTIEKIAAIFARNQGKALMPSVENTGRKPTLTDTIYSYVLDPKRRRSVLLLWWAFLVFVCLVVSTVLILISLFVFGSYRLGAYPTIILWSFLSAYFTYFFANEKVVTAFFGAAIGVGSSDSISGSGVVTNISNGINFVAQKVKEGYVNGFSVCIGEIRLMILVFLFVYAVLCAPVFFSKNSAV